MARVKSLKIEIHGLSATNKELQMKIWEVVANGGSWPREVAKDFGSKKQSLSMVQGMPKS